MERQKKGGLHRTTVDKDEPVHTTYTGHRDVSERLYRTHLSANSCPRELGVITYRVAYTQNGTRLLDLRLVSAHVATLLDVGVLFGRAQASIWRNAARRPLGRRSTEVY